MTIRRITMHQSAQRLAHAADRQGIALDPKLAQRSIGEVEVPPGSPRRARATPKKKRARRR